MCLSKDLESAREELGNIAENIVENNEAEGFVVHLHDGNTIKSDEVSVKKEVRLEAKANSVDVKQTLQEMKQYMKELDESGQLRA